MFVPVKTTLLLNTAFPTLRDLSTEYVLSPIDRVCGHFQKSWHLHPSSCRLALWSSSHLPPFSVPFPDLLLSWRPLQVLLPVMAPLSPSVSLSLSLCLRSSSSLPFSDHHYFYWHSFLLLSPLTTNAFLVCVCCVDILYACMFWWVCVAGLRVRIHICSNWGRLYCR